MLQVVAVFVGGIALAAWWRISEAPIETSAAGLGYASLAGLSVGLAEIGALATFARGAPISLGAPVIMGGSVLFAAALGLVVLREGLTAPQALGGALIVAGIALLSGR